MKLALKNISHSERLSEETHAYSATLYVDGKAFAIVSNHGHGGPDMVHSVDGRSNSAEFRARLEEIDAYLAETMKPTTFGDMTIKGDLEIWCGERVNDFLAAKTVKRLMRSRVLFTEPGVEGVREIRWTGLRKIDASHVEAVRQKKPKAMILNDLPLSEAVAIFRQAAA